MSYWQLRTFKFPGNSSRIRGRIKKKIVIVKNKKKIGELFTTGFVDTRDSAVFYCFKLYKSFVVHL